MKRSQMYLVIILLVSSLASCQRSVSENLIIGNWVSEDKADTLYITSDHSFNKSMHDAIQHTFDYSFHRDSIIIRYKGPNKIWVLETAHLYNLRNGELMIDFSNGCYGFTPEKVTFVRQKI